MPRYSIATTKDKLSSLIDRALAGEEVVVTRHGTPVVTLSAVPGARKPADKAEIYERLRNLHRSQPKNATPYLEMKRQEETERGY